MCIRDRVPAHLGSHGQRSVKWAMLLHTSQQPNQHLNYWGARSLASRLQSPPTHFSPFTPSSAQHSSYKTSRGLWQHYRLASVRSRMKMESILMHFNPKNAYDYKVTRNCAEADGSYAGGSGPISGGNLTRLTATTKLKHTENLHH